MEIWNLETYVLQRAGNQEIQTLETSRGRSSGRGGGRAISIYLSIYLSIYIYITYNILGDFINPEMLLRGAAMRGSSGLKDFVLPRK